MSKAQAAINRTNRAIDIYIEEYFTEIIDTLTTLSEKKYVTNAMKLGPVAHQRIQSEYLPITQSNKNFMHIYSGYENGLMIINDYTIPIGFDPTIRPWYQNAMDNKPHISVGRPYQDINTAQWLVATSKALQNSEGIYNGVISVDVSADQIGNHIAKFNQYETEFSFIIDKNNEIIMHPDQSLLNTSLQEKVGALQLGSQGSLIYRSIGVEYLAYYREIAATGWIAITMVEKNEIVYPIIVKVLVIIFCTVLFALFLGGMQSMRLSKQLSRPLFELSKKIQATILDEKVDDHYIYPNNEIGVMAHEIGQLAERAIKESEGTYKTIMQASPDSTIITDMSSNIIMSSAVTVKMFGYSQEELQGRSVMELIVSDDHARTLINQEIILREEQIGPDQFRAVRKDGTCFDIEVSIALIRGHEGMPNRLVIVTRDITARKESEKKIKELLQEVEIERDIAQKKSQTDGLTGLNNRRFFDDALIREFAMHKRSSSQLSLIMLDVDYFKKYNDHYGHFKGDQCLQLIADTLREVVARANDILARYGGEEFVIIASNTNCQGAEKLARRISQSIEELCLPHAKSDIAKFVTVSIGIATVTEPVLNEPEELLVLADKALYQAKNNGRNRYESLMAKVKCDVKGKVY